LCQLATICSPDGRPSELIPHGTLTAGSPTRAFLAADGRVLRGRHPWDGRRENGVDALEHTLELSREALSDLERTQVIDRGDSEAGFDLSTCDVRKVGWLLAQQIAVDEAGLRLDDRDQRLPRQLQARHLDRAYLRARAI
jgi:hypothetical protein